jgi:ParB-like chromosome segregation protein Spo0J
LIQSGAPSPVLASPLDPATADSARDRYDTAEIVRIPLSSLRPGDSPRLKGEDNAHVARLAQLDSPLPPILVDKRSMQVIDGMHRLMAASLRGQDMIDVVFYTGCAEDVFLRAVEENIAHGLPLTRADRRAAALRIIDSHPEMSDRAIAHSVGLSAKTVGAIRRSAGKLSEMDARVGRDGKVRPLDGAQGRMRAAALLKERPTASLQQVAKIAGISHATARDVKKRLTRGEDPVTRRSPAAEADSRFKMPGPKSLKDIKDPKERPDEKLDPAAVVQKLLRDPSLRQKEHGRGLVQFLHANAIGAQQLDSFVAAVPSHWITIIDRIARQYAIMWAQFAESLEARASVIDPGTVWSTTVTSDSEVCRTPIRRSRNSLHSRRVGGRLRDSPANARGKLG